LIFVIYAPGAEDHVVFSYPIERFDFDASDLPELVRGLLEEAIDCYANQCFKAAVLMIRRTLEMVCLDRGAEGRTLFERIEALGKEVVLPAEMVDGLHNLRLLGNDAAHVEAREFMDVGQEEVEAALEVTKLILAATYQSTGALAALQALKADPESP
jgi:hypothetical protein